MHGLAQNISFWLLGALFVCGCGTRMPEEVPVPPPLTLPEAGSCPGALPGANIQVSSAIGESNAPVLTWTGNGFTIAWWDLRGRFPEVRTVQMNRDGTVRHPEQRIPYEGAARDHSIAFDGRETHLVFVDGEKVVSHKMGKRGTVKTVAQGGKMPAAGAFGAVVWVSEGNLWFVSDAMIVAKTKTAKEVGPTRVVVARGGIETPQMVFNGRFFGIVWSSSVKGGREIRFQRVSPRGRLLGSTVQVSREEGVSRKPAIALSGGNFAVAWTHSAPEKDNPDERFRVYLAVIPEVGDQPLMTRQLSFRGSADEVALAATGQEFGLSWVGSRHPRGSAVYFGRMGLDGEPIDSTIEVTDGVPLTCGRPSLVWDGSGYGVVWHDDRARTGSEVFFSYIECGEETPTLDFTSQQEVEESGEAAGDSGPREESKSTAESKSSLEEGAAEENGAPLPGLKEVFD